MQRLVPALAVLYLACVAISGASASDSEIAREITGRLKHEQDAGNLWGFDINLQVEEGRVLLSGHVASQEQRQLAHRIARQVRGVDQVVNQLRVESSVPVREQATAVAAPRGPSDAEIAAEIADQLRAHQKRSNLRGFSIDLSVENGVATLQGHVPDQEQMSLALDSAWDVAGVRDVVNELDVQGSEPVSTRLTSSGSEKPAMPQLAPRPLDRAAAQPQRTRSARPSDPPAAWTVANSREPVGLRSQTALAAVEPPVLAHPSSAQPVASSARASSEDRDQQIGNMLIGQLRDAKDRGELRGFGINVNVEDGVIHLSGRVASYEQEQLVLEKARRIPGTRKVVRDMDVQQRSLAAQPVSYPNVLMPNADDLARDYSASGDQTPLPLGAVRGAAHMGGAALGAPLMAINHLSAGGPAALPGAGQADVPARYDHPNLPGYAWPTYAAYPNYAAVTYPTQYSPTAWPYIGPFHPYPQVPLGWRKVTLRWDDGWWKLQFQSR